MSAQECLFSLSFKPLSMLNILSWIKVLLDSVWITNYNMKCFFIENVGKVLSLVCILLFFFGGGGGGKG